MLLVLEFTPLKKHFGSFSSFWVLSIVFLWGNRIGVPLIVQTADFMLLYFERSSEYVIFFHRTICRPCWSSWCFSSTSSLVHCPVCGPMKRTVGHASLAAWQLPKHQNGSKPENHQDKTVEVSYYVFSTFFLPKERNPLFNRIQT